MPVFCEQRTGGPAGPSGQGDLRKGESERFTDGDVQRRCRGWGDPAEAGGQGDHGTSRDQVFTLPEEWRRCPESPDSWLARWVKDQTQSSFLSNPRCCFCFSSGSLYLSVQHLSSVNIYPSIIYHHLPISCLSIYLHIHSSICLSTHHLSSIIHPLSIIYLSMVYLSLPLCLYHLCFYCTF